MPPCFSQSIQTVSNSMGLGNYADDEGTVCIQKTSNSPVRGMRFSLKRMREDIDPLVASQSLLKTSRRKLSKRHVDGSDDERNLFQALKNKPWLSYYNKKDSSEDESDFEETATAHRSSSRPVGVVRGCPSCENCQKVLARWRPEAGCRPWLEDAPVFFPLEEEFQDTVKYIASISAEAEQYGICRIVPPHSWRPPCPLKESDKRRTTMFPTRVQRVDKLQVREAQAKKEEKKRKGNRFSQSLNDACSDSSDEDCKFGFEPGPSFTLETFEKYAHQFKDEYFGLGDRNEGCNGSLSKDEPSIECIEGEYWRIVEHATEQLEVLYGADIETGKFGSGFPKATSGTGSSSYESSGWNLNNIARLAGSVLSFEEEEISGVLVPWLYVGMCLSSFCWHVEDHHFYSLNYMHFGAPKVWYGVPGNAAHKLEDAMKKHLPELFEEQPDLLHKLVTQLSPSLLKADGVPVYRAVQKPGEFVITFPRAYHAGFNCGFNCAEAVNVAPIDWLPAGQNAIELYKQQKRKSTVSHDKLLLGAVTKYLAISHNFPGLPADADSATWHESFAQHKALLKVLKDRVDLERSRRSNVENFVLTRRMDKNFDSNDAKECSVCHYDLHLSAVGCECAHERYTCLEHVQELCACEKTKKHALYRYELSELDALVAALEGKLDAVGDVDNLLKLFAGSKASQSSSNESKKHEGLAFEQAGVSSFGAGSKASHSTCNESKTRESSTTEQADVSSLGAGSKVSHIYCNELKRQEGSTIEQAGATTLEAESKVSHVNRNESKKFEGLTTDQAGVSTIGAGSNLASFGTVYATNSGVSSLGAGSNSASLGDSSTYGTNLGAHISTIKAEAQTIACTPVESMWNGGFKAMSAFLLKDFENFEQLIASSRASEVTSAECQARNHPPAVPTNPRNSEWSRQLPPCGYAPAEEKKCMEVIELSDDEDCLGSQSASNRSHTISPTVANRPDADKGCNSSKGFCLPSQKPGIIAPWNSSGLQNNPCGQPDRPSVLAPEEDEKVTLTLQHMRSAQISPTLYANLQNCGAKDATPGKDWLCLGSLQTSSINQGYEFPVTGLSFSQSRYEGESQVNYIATSAAVANSLLSNTQPQELGTRVDLLCTGRLVLGMSWCNKDAIFPAGFRSRVLFPSILDPCKICFYVSEILDYGHTEPVFKVSLEDHPNEVFLHSSIDRCWQMVQERINIMIQLYQSLGKVGLPCIRAPEDIRGLELFGFTTPHIIKAVESLDWRHQCLQYWAGRLSAIGLLQTQHHSQVANVNETGFLVSHLQSRNFLQKAAPMSFNSMAMHNVWR